MRVAAVNVCTPHDGMQGWSVGTYLIDVPSGPRTKWSSTANVDLELVRDFRSCIVTAASWRSKYLARWLHRQARRSQAEGVRRGGCGR